jgi:hypothetical protein
MKYFLLTLFLSLCFACKKDEMPKCVTCYAVAQKNPGPKCGTAYNSKNGGWDEISRTAIEKYCNGEWTTQDGIIISQSPSSAPCTSGNTSAYFDTRIIVECPY